MTKVALAGTALADELKHCVASAFKAGFCAGCVWSSVVVFVISLFG
jgi:hypothetical protein